MTWRKPSKKVWKLLRVWDYTSGDVLPSQNINREKKSTRRLVFAILKSVTFTFLGISPRIAVRSGCGFKTVMWASGRCRRSSVRCPRTLRWSLPGRESGRRGRSYECRGLWRLSHPGGVFVWKPASPYQEGCSGGHESRAQSRTDH